MLNLLETLPSHTGKVWSVAWNASGNMFASCGEDKSVNIWACIDAKKNYVGQPPTDKGGWVIVSKLADTHQRTVRDVAFSPCGKYIAVASFDATVSIWEKQNMKKYECVTTVEGHENEVKSVAWSPSGQFFATCGRDKNVMIWSMSTDGEYEVECESVLTVHTQDVKRIVWHPLEDILVSVSYDDTIKFHQNDPNDGDWTCTETLTGHDSTVWGVDFDATGNRIATCSADRTVKIWSKIGVSWDCVSTLSGFHDRAIYDISWSKHNGLILTGCGDDHIRVFREAQSAIDGEKYTFDPVCTVKAHEADVNRVKWNPRIDGLVLSAGDDGCVKVWSWVED